MWKGERREIGRIIEKLCVKTDSRKILDLINGCDYDERVRFLWLRFLVVYLYFWDIIIFFVFCWFLLTELLFLCLRVFVRIIDGCFGSFWLRRLER